MQAILIMMANASNGASDVSSQLNDDGGELWISII